MGTRHFQKVINKKGEIKVAQYGQWDGYPSSQGVDILKYLKKGDLTKYQEELEKIVKPTDEQNKIIENDPYWVINYPYLSRDCGSDIHKMIEEGKVPFVQLMEDEEANKYCEGFYTIDFQKNEFKCLFHNIEHSFDLDNLPNKKEFLKIMEP